MVVNTNKGMLQSTNTILLIKVYTYSAVAGVLDEPDSQLIPLSGVAV